MFDLIIKNGKIIDGTGSPSYFADIAVKDGKIVKIGKGLKQASKVIDAAGLCVTPGFIDSHSHSDSNIINLPEQREKVEQGITSCIGGQCGSSAAPISRDAKPEDFEGDEFITHKTMSSFLEHVKDIPQGCNITTLLGHGNLRKSVMGLENREPTAQEMEKMKELLSDAMDHGARGLSFGLYYAPGNYAKTEEAVELAKVVAAKGGVIAAHIRNEDDHLVQALREYFAIVRSSHARAIVSHHKVYGSAENWGKVTHTLRMIDEMNNEGYEVYCDVYPYTAAGTALSSAFLPKGVYSQGLESLIKRLDEPEYRKEIRNFITSNFGTEFDWVKTASGNPYPECNGMTIPEIAKVKEVDQIDAILNTIRDSGTDCYASFFSICEEDIELVMAHPRTMICTDSGNAGDHKSYHPRLRGSFPRVLGRYVRERKVTSLPEMIRKMTSMPARVYGLTGKGLIWENMDADICIFDENKIIDKCDYDNVHARAEGLNYVIVGGKIAAENAVSNGERYGKVML